MKINTDWKLKVLLTFGIILTVLIIAVPLIFSIISYDPYNTLRNADAPSYLDYLMFVGSIIAGLVGLLGVFSTLYVSYKLYKVSEKAVEIADQATNIADDTRNAQVSDNKLNLVREYITMIRELESTDSQITEARAFQDKLSGIINRRYEHIYRQVNSFFNHVIDQVEKGSKFHHSTTIRTNKFPDDLFDTFLNNSLLDRNQIRLINYFFQFEWINPAIRTNPVIDIVRISSEHHQIEFVISFSNLSVSFTENEVRKDVIQINEFYENDIMRDKIEFVMDSISNRIKNIERIKEFYVENCKELQKITGYKLIEFTQDEKA